jgi:DNA-directed RNA polymerase subunit RPC12/RpoP
MIEELTIYKCTNCGKTYDTDPVRCDCNKKRVPGKVIGPFKLKEAMLQGRWKVQCLLCTQIKTIHGSNLLRQKSCGCAPKSVDIMHVTPDFLRYQCKRCGRTTSTNLPVFEWCCNDE